jgi:uncharacterized protein YkwD
MWPRLLFFIKGNLLFIKGKMNVACLSAVAGVLTALGVSGCQPAPTPQATPQVMYSSLSHADAQVDTSTARAIISAYRLNKGIKALTLDPKLTKIASQEAQNMALRDKTNSVDDIKKTLTSQGITGAGVNASAGYHTLAEAFSGWRDSPEHNRTMLLAGASRMGIATAYAPQSKYKVYWALIIAPE